MAERAGKVYLVGAGPGAADLITLRAAEIIQYADAIVYDILANQELLGAASPSAEVIGVGEPSRDAASPHEAVTRVLIERARAGESVVRLSDGDPFFFGRAADEAKALAAAGIDFEVVPGLSLAYAAPAFAGIPLGGREHGATVSFVNIDPNPAIAEPPPLWAELAGVARLRGTLVLSTEAARIQEIAGRLTAERMPADTPAAAIFNGGAADQKVIEATIATLAAAVAHAKPAGPAIVVIGERAAMRHQLRWFERRPLFGRRIVVTRGGTNSGVLTRPLRAHGAEVVEFPTIQTTHPDSYAALDAALADLGSFDWVIFTSANGVDSFIERMTALGRDIRELGRARIGAIGPATAARLKRYALRIEVQPSEYRAEAIAHAIGTARIRGARFLIPRAQVAREALPEILVEQGASAVEVVSSYKTVMPKGARTERMRRMVDAGLIDLVAFTSSSTVTNFCAIMGGAPHGLKAGAIGPITAETARTLGFEVVVSPSDYTIDALVAALIDYFARRKE